MRKKLTRQSFLKVGGGTLAGMYALGLAGCGSQSGGGTAELTILEHQEPRVKLLEEMIPQFEEEMKQKGKDVRVEILEGPAPDEEFMTKLTLDFSSNNAPDVTSGGNTATTNFASSGYLLDVSPYVEKWPDWEDHFYKRLRDEMIQPDGKVYSIPREAQIIQLFYRRDVLSEAGISTEQPKSWQDLYDRMLKATEATGSPSLLFPAGESWGAGTFGEGFIHLMLGTDSPLYENEKWVVRSTGLTKVLNYYEKLADAGVMPVQPLLNPEPWVPTKYEAFPNGELIASTCGTWCWIFDWGPQGAAPIENLFDKVDTWQFPTADGDGTFVWGATNWAWLISAQTEYPDEAWELVKWLGSSKFMAKNAVAIGAAAPRDDLADVEPYSEYEFLIQAEQQLPNARSFPSVVGTDKIALVAAEATQAVITGKMSGEEAADLFARRATELLGEDEVKGL